MKLNKKGFAITGFLYSIFAVFIVILSMLIMSMISSKLVLNKIKNEVKNELDEEYTGTSIYERTFLYTGTSQTFTAPYSGWYKVELWGAEGGSSSNKGGLGSYTKGNIYLDAGNTVYIYIGGAGKNNNDEGIILGGYNGGGNALANTDSNNGSGGGATDIRIDSSLNSRLMVAAGGGGAVDPTTVTGSGGTLTSRNAVFNSSTTYIATGATQISAGGGNVNGSFGQGANGDLTYRAGGGGGYYGGGIHTYVGSGGSSYISGYAGVNSILSSSSTDPSYSTLHYSGKYFIDGRMEAGINEGDGKATIKYISNVDVETTNTNLNNVRYIKDCINGNTINSWSHWVELQAIKNGVNLAYGLAVTGTTPITNSSYITDGDITFARFGDTYPASGLQCITVDLETKYNLDEIAVWHYWNGGRTYYDNVTYVSSDGSNWIEVINSGNQAETSNGKRVSAYEE